MTEGALEEVLKWIAVISLLGGWLFFMAIAWDRIQARQIQKREIFKDVDPEAPNLDPFDPHTTRWRNEMIERERQRNPDDDLGL